VNTGGTSLRVLICEDSKTYAAALRHALEHDQDIEVIGCAASGEEALAAARAGRPDVITMDIELPGMSGLQAVEQVMGNDPCPIVIISSHLGPSSDAAATALAAGALDAISKEDLDLGRAESASAEALRARVKQLSRVRVIRHPRARLLPRPVPDGTVGAASVIGMCASTGGPQALAAILAMLPSSFAIPILVVQHITDGFHEGLARWLDTSVPLPVRLAAPGRHVTPGVWIAPGGAHLRLGHGGTLLQDLSTPAGRHRPSGDILLTSLADIAGRNAVAVVLSGMGRDGAAGAQAIRRTGGMVFAQEQATAAVYGMPKAAADTAEAVVLSLAMIAARLAALRPEALAK
jgi:two-component system, chemotaxis family, protein-glutamate methylesterase/glutaminase